MFHILPLAAMITMQSPPSTTVDHELLTVAEASDYTATASHAQVLALIERIGSRSKVMRVIDMGSTSEGKRIPLLLFGDPKPAVTSSRAKPLVFVMANIHAGEVEGKEATLMLAREFALNPDHPLLKDLDVILCPIYNGDGNDRFDTCEKNRPGQDGPTMVGVRANAMGLDLNRDYIKLEAPETRALVKFLNDYDPSLTIDCHTTNGSHHRYALTYDAPLNPSGAPGPIDFVRNQMLPTVTQRIKDHTGYDLWFYGNFNREHTTWETYSPQPRFGGSYQGLRNQMSVLSEAYSYAPYKDRCIATREFIREILQFVAEHKQEVLEINRKAREDVIAKGEKHDNMVGIRHAIAAFDEPVLVKGFEGTAGKGGEGGSAILKHDELGPPKDYQCKHFGKFEPTLIVKRPFAYIIPATPGMNTIVEKLRQHGIQVEPFEGTAGVEVYTITKVNRADQAFQNHHTDSVDVAVATRVATFAKGAWIVRTDKPLGTLAVYMLEPQSEDGLVTWNFFDDVLKEGAEFPVVRVPNGS